MTGGVMRLRGPASRGTNPLPPRAPHHSAPSRLPCSSRTAAFSPGPLPWCSRCSSRGSTTFDPAGSGAGRRHPALRAVILDRAQISVRRLGAAAAVILDRAQISVRRLGAAAAVILDRAQISVRRLGAAAAVRAAELQRNPPGRAPTPAAACRGGEVEDGSHSPSQVGLARRRLSSKRHHGGLAATSPHLLLTSAGSMVHGIIVVVLDSRNMSRREGQLSRPSSVHSRSSPSHPSSTPPSPLAVLVSSGR
ncbi:uncharacterized protein LOC119272840 [Triticum dicoccoides]|uniref:uncharacterized protein LOC119272840 n=1 Tax=Triticum dicoccoides TaxID=85692 RepID=UPI00188EAAD2|nr:uncharacterized protein LOC119272840 [Triticum dicoccoides]